jgi:protein CpxP
MRKLILTGLSFLFAITLTFAQDINPETKAKQKVDELTQVLTLNEDQQASIFTIVLEKVSAKHAIKADTTLAADVAKQQIEAAQATAHQKISELLNDDQKVVFAKYTEDQKGKKEKEQGEHKEEGNN